ncbi:hypothetical protein HXX76_011461 [Chlamydomonas incerta]|uniref:Glycosyl transferase CAP10 domain-containing protein n=1 Tax=Chlamydomonas incerta TaxID=51695 RepID=A0A835VX36_CHLIN|nr:hypothetical protein HXX76_011461 [Chlamydomonas incerta]|eukprot:KAG2428759.1 hypothetical protein HXX76_011461 [Chlamydomonas incerta]
MSRQDRGVGVAADHQTQHAGVQAQRRLAAGSRYAAAAKAPAAEAEAAARRRDKKSRKGRKNRGGARGKSGGDGTPDAGDASGGVLQVPLEEYDWREVEQSMEELLEPALGPEVRYWRGRPSPVSCDDVAAEVVRLHAKSLVYIRTILVRNNQWYFLNPADDADAARKSPEAVDGSRWPLLNATRHCSHYCHYQMSSLWLGVKPLLDAARANASVPRGLPDMVFVLNVADNSPPDQHYGRLARAPLLSLLKRWDEPWWQPPAAGGSGGDDSEAAASLGRLPDGELLQPLQLPSRVRERVAALAQRTGSDGADAAEVSVALPLPEARGGRAAESASWKEAQESEDPLRELVRRFVASMPASVAAADIPEDVSEKPRKRTDKDPEMDLLLPVMHYSAQSLSFFPWANKTDKAIFSGSAFREKYKTSHSPLSVRTHVGQLAAQHPDDLDVRLRELSQKATAPPVSITDHARYRWLLSMDGVSASSRLGLLMGLDSVLVKSRSAYIEAYSRLQVRAQGQPGYRCQV